MQCNWLLDHFVFKQPVLSMHRELFGLSAVEVSANREICCQYTTIVHSSRVVLYYSLVFLSTLGILNSSSDSP